MAARRNRPSGEYGRSFSERRRRIRRANDGRERGVQLSLSTGADIVPAMNWVFATGLIAFLALPTNPGVHELTADIPGVGTVLYAVSVPRGYTPDKPAPLVVALHSGGERMRFYGSAFTKLLVLPGVES